MRQRKPLGLVLWEGQSRFSPLHRIAVVLTGIRQDSKNAKTGAMRQVWILPVDGSPMAALKTGADESVCGDCRLRPILSKSIPGSARCYVDVSRAPSGVARAYHAGSYTPATPELLARFVAGSHIRFGAWGDPAAAPAHVWQTLSSLPGVRWTGYSHGALRFGLDGVKDLRSLVMFSADDASSALAAQSAGWRTFRVRQGSTDPLLPGEIACPASAEGGSKIQCDACLLCDGSARMDLRRLPNVAIIDHGPTSRRARPEVM